MTTTTILEVPTDDPRLLALVTVHRDYAVANSPPGSGYAVDPDQEDLSGLRYWLAMREDLPIGCVALKARDARSAEIKTMHVLAAHRGQGTADLLLDVLEAAARQAAFRELVLETGKSEAFAPARQFYTRRGFRPCAAFEPYTTDPFSYCMKKVL